MCLAIYSPTLAPKSIGLMIQVWNQTQNWDIYLQMYVIHMYIYIYTYITCLKEKQNMRKYGVYICIIHVYTPKFWWSTLFCLKLQLTLGLGLGTCDVEQVALGQRLGWSLETPEWWMIVISIQLYIDIIIESNNIDHVYIYIYAFVYIYVCLCIYICLCIHLHIYIYMCVYICMYKYIYMCVLSNATT